MCSRRSERRPPGAARHVDHEDVLTRASSRSHPRSLASEKASTRRRLEQTDRVSTAPHVLGSAARLDRRGRVSGVSAHLRRPETIHAICEDYRAAASIDLAHDQADLDKKIRCSLLVLWSEKGT